MSYTVLMLDDAEQDFFTLGKGRLCLNHVYPVACQTA
jgi:hypothetical protein